MAFKYENLTCFANNGKTGIVPALWVYWNEEDDTTTTAGYFPNDVRLSDKDVVKILSSDSATRTEGVVSITDGVVTVS